MVGGLAAGGVVGDGRRAAWLGTGGGRRGWGLATCGVLGRLAAVLSSPVHQLAPSRWRHPDPHVHMQHLPLACHLSEFFCGLKHCFQLWVLERPPDFTAPLQSGTQCSVGFKVRRCVRTHLHQPTHHLHGNTGAGCLTQDGLGLFVAITHHTRRALGSCLSSTARGETRGDGADANDEVGVGPAAAEEGDALCILLLDGMKQPGIELAAGVAVSAAAARREKRLEAPFMPLVEASKDGGAVLGITDVAVRRQCNHKLLRTRKHRELQRCNPIGIRTIHAASPSHLARSIQQEGRHRQVEKLTSPPEWRPAMCAWETGRCSLADELSHHAAQQGRGGGRGEGGGR